MGRHTAGKQAALAHSHCRGEARQAGLENMRSMCSSRERCVLPSSDSCSGSSEVVPAGSCTGVGAVNSSGQAGVQVVDGEKTSSPTHPTTPASSSHLGLPGRQLPLRLRQLAPPRCQHRLPLLQPLSELRCLGLALRCDGRAMWSGVGAGVGGMRSRIHQFSLTAAHLGLPPDLHLTPTPSSPSLVSWCFCVVKYLPKENFSPCMDDGSRAGVWVGAVW